MANGNVTDRERGLLNRGLTAPAWGTEAFRFVKPDGTSYTLEFKGGTGPARWTAQAWANYYGHKLISENPRATYERPLSPPPLVQAQPVEPELSPPPLVQAVPITPKTTRSKKAVKAKPRQTTVTFDDDDAAEIVGYRLPKTAPAAIPWAEDDWRRALKDLLLRPSRFRYSTFELRGPEPPSRVPKLAVAYWLSLHKGDIVQAERKYGVSRLAIAGIIAWEALVNPQVASYKAVGPGKMHLEGEGGQLSWPDVIESAGKMKPLFSLPLRRVEMAKANVAINYIAAALDLIAEVAEQSGWNIRNHPEILGQVYHGWTFERWQAAVKTKKPGAPFEIVSGMIGKWTQDQSQYLEAAVGAPEQQ